MFPYDFATPWPLGLILLAAGGAGLLTWRGYRRRAGEVSAWRGRLLKALRYSGWSLAFLCLMQPVYREVRRLMQQSRLTVLVDDSESMSFSDGGRSGTRMARVREALGTGEDSGLLAGLRRDFEVRMEAFSGSARPVDSPAELTAQGERTDLAQGLNDALARLRGPLSSGLILFSDGVDTQRGDMARSAANYRRAGLPIYAVGVGAPVVCDLSIAQVRARRFVSKDTLVRVEADVLSQGLAPGPRTARLVRNGRTVKEQKVEVSGGKGTALFEFLPAEQGFLEYEVRVDPHPAELVHANNSLAFGLVSASRKLKVLYMEGSVYQHAQYHRMLWQTRWEHQFLQEALEEDQDVEVEVLLHPADRTTPPEGVKTVKEGYPRRKRDLYQYDVVINSDIPYDLFSPEQVSWTVDFVGKHGGGFVMIGGWHAFGEGGYAKTPFDRMLPVEMNPHDRHADGEDFRWRVTDEGWSHPIMQIDPDPANNRRIWEKLNLLGGTSSAPAPSFHGYSKTTRPKPAAGVLAVIADERLEGPYGPMVIVAVQPYGRGRSMAFTTDTTGGWGAEWEDSWGDDLSDPARRNRYYKTFWKNAVRWLAHFRLQAPNQLVLLELDRLVYGRGETPEVNVKVLNEDYEPTHEAQLKVTVRGPDGAVRELPFYPRYDEPGLYVRKLELGAPGRYELTASASLRGEELGRDKCLLQVRPASAELRRLGQDVETLQKLAEQSGGTYLELSQAASLPDTIRHDSHVFDQTRTSDLWDRPWVFMVLVSLFCAEWFFRKKWGLP